MNSDILNTIQCRLNYAVAFEVDIALIWERFLRVFGIFHALSYRENIARFPNSPDLRRDWILVYPETIVAHRRYTKANIGNETPQTPPQGQTVLSA
jgi:hypothetical protein